MKFILPQSNNNFDIGENVKFEINDVADNITSVTLFADNQYILGNATKNNTTNTWVLEKRFSGSGNRLITAKDNMNNICSLNINVSYPSINGYTPPQTSLNLLGDIVRKLEENGVHKWDTKFIGGKAIFTLNSGNFFIDSDFDLDTDGSKLSEAGGTHQSDTSLHDNNDNPLDANSIPFYVIPLKSQFLKNGVSMGDIGVVVCNNKISAGFFGDYGPKTKIGEGSIQMHRELGFERVVKKSNGKYRIIDVGIDRVVMVVFPGSGSDLVHNGKLVKSVDETVSIVRERGKKLWTDLGGNWS